MVLRLTDITVVHLSLDMSTDEEYINLITDHDLRESEDGKQLIELINKYYSKKNRGEKMKKGGECMSHNKLIKLLYIFYPLSYSQLRSCLKICSWNGNITIHLINSMIDNSEK